MISGGIIHPLFVSRKKKKKEARSHSYPLAYNPNSQKQKENEKELALTITKNGTIRTSNHDISEGNLSTPS